jgi:hypothetical protein
MCFIMLHNRNINIKTYVSTFFRNCNYFHPFRLFLFVQKVNIKPFRFFLYQFNFFKFRYLLCFTTMLIILHVKSKYSTITNVNVVPKYFFSCTILFLCRASMTQTKFFRLKVSHFLQTRILI